MDAVMNRDDQAGWYRDRGLVMRDVKNIHLVFSQRHWQDQVIPPYRVLFRLDQLLEVRGQGSQILKVKIGADQSIFIGGVHFSKIADEIPDVGADAELVDLSNIDCDAHGSVRTAIL
jgi:hypothetical protein